jgi:hypothetical protein
MMPLLALLDPIIGKLLAFIPDPAQKAAAQLALLQAQQAGEFKLIDAALSSDTAQDQINAAEAGKELTFRDGAGWVCVVALAMTALKAPIEWGCALAGHPVALPAPDTSITTSMLLGLLGLGGMHVYEKTR